MNFPVFRSKDRRADAKPGLANVAVISPLDEDISSLERLLRTSQDESALVRWAVIRLRTLESAIAELNGKQVPVLICECDEVPNAWLKLLCEITALPRPPLLILISRLADERLWAEALNLGAWDLMAKPLDRREVNRVLNTALLRWHDRYDSALAPCDVEFRTATVSNNGVRLGSGCPGGPLEEPETA